MKHAYFLVVPNTHLLDLAGPLQIVMTLRELGIANVAVECVGPLGTVRSFQATMLSEVRPLPSRLPPGAALFAIGSKLDESFMSSKPWLDTVAWLRDQASHAAPDSLQICGVCTGSFLLAQAGLLDGRLCTTHHRYTRKLQEDYPAAHVTENRVYVRDGHIWTSAGVTSGIDLALHFVADVFGADAAVQVARENVAHFRRFGGDPEWDAQLRYRSHANAFVHSAQDAIARNLSAKVTCDDIAQIVGYSSRHLARLFVAETGVTIKRYQTELRMDLARRLLTDSTLSVERIAERCGFDSVQAFRANWDKFEKEPPSALRSRRGDEGASARAAGRTKTVI